MPLTQTVLENSLYFPLLYGALATVLFAVVYNFMGLKKHFVLADDVKNNPWFASFYISFMAQTNAMGDATPKTIPARAVFALQTLMGWMWLASFSPIVTAMLT